MPDFHSDRRCPPLTATPCGYLFTPVLGIQSSIPNPDRACPERRAGIGLDQQAFIHRAPQGPCINKDSGSRTMDKRLVVKPRIHEAPHMRSVEEIKAEIKALPRQEYIRLAHWFSERDWGVWDEELERDSNSGKLDFLIEEALDEKKRGGLGEL